MMNRIKFIGANWKMNFPPKGALAEGTVFFSHGDPNIVVFPTYIDLHNCICSGELIVGAQCGRAEDSGAFTGDVSMSQLKECGCSYVLCGHSERRQHHKETDEDIAVQVISALKAGLIPILCIGETEKERSEGKTNDVLRQQLSSLLRTHTSQLTAESILIAYEPVWAIGSGKTPTTAEAETLHQFIRSLLPDANIRIIYGGSVNGSNAAAFFAQPNIDGGLIGGASLKPDDFQKIVDAAKSTQ